MLEETFLSVAYVSVGASYFTIGGLSGESSSYYWLPFYSCLMVSSLSSWRKVGLSTMDGLAKWAVLCIVLMECLGDSIRVPGVIIESCVGRATIYSLVIKLTSIVCYLLMLGASLIFLLLLIAVGGLNYDNCDCCVPKLPFFVLKDWLDFWLSIDEFLFLMNFWPEGLVVETW